MSQNVLRQAMDESEPEPCGYVIATRRGKEERTPVQLVPQRDPAWRRGISA